MAVESKLWVPTHEDMEQAEQAYLRYATGVAMIHNPDHVVSLVLLDRPPKDPNARRFMEILHEQRKPEILAAGAERLMWRGLKKILKNTNPPELRRDLTDTRDRYTDVRPILDSLVDIVTNPDIDSDITDALFDLDMSLSDPNLAPLPDEPPTSPPMPLLDERIYRYVATGTPLSVRTVELLGGFAVDPTLEHIVTPGRRIVSGTINSERAKMFVAPVEKDLSPKIS